MLFYCRGITVEIKFFNAIPHKKMSSHNNRKISWSIKIYWILYDYLNKIHEYL